MPPEEALRIAKNHISTAPSGINCAYTGKLKIGEGVRIRPNGKTSDPDVKGSFTIFGPKYNYYRL